MMTLLNYLYKFREETSKIFESTNIAKCQSNSSIVISNNQKVEVFDKVSI